MRPPATALLTLLALVAFASNSILTRLALGTGAMDAATFTTVRLAAGAVVLLAIVRVRGRTAPGDGGRGRLVAPRRRRGLRLLFFQAAAIARFARGRLVGPLALFAYAAPFTFAYVRIGAATGALLLFGSVQITMIGWGIASGERPRVRAWIGIAAAAAGLAWLVLPSLRRPDPVGSALMVVAGCAWGVYSLAGRKAANALAANARSFAWAVPLALLLKLSLQLAAPSSMSTSMSARGFILAAVSGGVTSGVGYAIWYRALRGLSATQAGIVQLSVPVIAAGGAVAFLGESVSPRLAIAGAAVIGGVALVLSDRARPRPS